MGALEKFTSVAGLQGIGQILLIRFLESFTADLAAERILLPSSTLPEKIYLPAVAAIFAVPASLPARLVEALSALDELTEPACRARVHLALAANGTHLTTDPDASPGRLAVQLWLAVPALLPMLDTFTLDPLATEGKDALLVEDVPGLRKAILRRIDVGWENAFFPDSITVADDIFQCSAAYAADHDTIPKGAALLHAIFDLTFIDSPDPRSIEIRPPYTLSLAHAADAPVVRRWLSQRHFRVPLSQSIPRKSPSNASSMANP